MFFSIYAVQKRNTISNKLSIWKKVGSRYFLPSKLNPWETLVPNFHTTFSNIIATPSRNFQCLVSNVKPLMTASCSCFRLFPTGSSSLLLWEKQLHHQIRCGRRLYLVTCLSLSNNYKNHMQQKCTRPSWYKNHKQHEILLTKTTGMMLAFDIYI